MSEFKFELGDKVRDTITGFEGVIAVKSKWLNGCIRYGVQSRKLDKDGKPVDVQTFDEPAIELVKEKEKESVVTPGGGDRSDPVRSW